MAENLCQLYIRQGTDNQNEYTGELKKLNSQKINEEVGN
jgi:hypothetical protein